MAEVIDLRAFLRSTDVNVVVHIDGDLVEVIDISVAGIRIARPQRDLLYRNVEFRIIPRSSAGLELHRAIPVCGHIVGEGSDHVRIAFASVTTALANVIRRYQAKGTEEGDPAADMPAGQTAFPADRSAPGLH